MIGYSLAAPDDTNADNAPVWYGGSKLAPDLSINRLRERLATQDVADRPQGTVGPAEVWRRAESAVRTAGATLGSVDVPAAQGHLDAFAETLHNMALATRGPARNELHATATAFDRARRSAIRADHQAATALRQAAKDLVTASSEPGGIAIALVFAALHGARAAAKWHEQRGHEQQAAAAAQARSFLQAGYEKASAPVLADLARHSPAPEVAERYAEVVREALPTVADRILSDTRVARPGHHHRPPSPRPKRRATIRVAF